MLLRSTELSLVLLALTACADLTAPGNRIDGKAQREPEPAAPPTPAASAVPPPEPPDEGGEGETIRASHVLVAFKGAMRAGPEVTRTKEEAKKRAQEIRTRAKKGEDFAALAREMSDGPTGPRGGDLGRFSRERMVKPFADAAFELEPGATSDVVETNFGFHVIKRTE